MDFDQAWNVLDEHLLGSLTFITGAQARCPGMGLSLAVAALPAITANAPCA